MYFDRKKTLYLTITVFNIIHTPFTTQLAMTLPSLIRIFPRNSPCYRIMLKKTPALYSFGWDNWYDLIETMICFVKFESLNSMLARIHSTILQKKNIWFLGSSIDIYHLFHFFWIYLTQTKRMRLTSLKFNFSHFYAHLRSKRIKYLIL